MASIDVSELRIVLLGKNSLEVSRVGNFILRRDAFDTVAPPPSVEQHSERAGGKVEGRYITLINTSHLFNPHLSQEELTRRMKECMFLSAPGPHAIVLVLQPDSFTETDRERLHHILFSLSEEPYKHSLTLTTQLLLSGSTDRVQENIIPEIITACRNRHFRFSTECSRSALIEMIEEMVVENGGYYTWKEIVSSPLATEQQQQHEQSTTHKESEQTEQQKKSTQQSKKDLSELRIVLLGKERSDISRVGNSILGRDAFDIEAPPPSIEQHSERASGNVEGRYITLINTPHLFNVQLPQTELLHRVKECVYLCAPGPHVFLLVLQSVNFTRVNLDRVKNVLNTYSPLSMKYSVVLTTDTDSGLKVCLQSLTNECEGRHLVYEEIIENHQLLDTISAVVKQNGGDYLTCDLSAQLPVEFVLQKHSGSPDRDQACFTETAKTDGEKSRGLTYKKEKAKAKASKLRIVLLGKNSSEISRVGNFILGRDVFDTEAPPPTEELHSERARGNVEGRYITLINTPQLLGTQLTVAQLDKEVKECMSLCAPGPHVIVLVLQPDDFTETDRHRLNHILRSLSEDVQKYTLTLTTHMLQSDTGVDPVEETVCQKIITEWSNRHFEFNSECSRGALVEMMENIIEDNGGAHLQWDEFEETQHKRELLQPEQLVRKTTQLKSEFEIEDKLSEKLNLVLCGSDGAVKSSISDLILGQRERSTEFSSVCVRREGEVCGCLVTLVEMPALYNTQLSEAEVMKETYRCVSLCDPGVHAFLFIIPDGPLTDEDKGEIEKLEIIFGSRINNYLLLITPHSQNKQLSESVKTYERRYLTGSETDAEKVIQCVKKLLKKNNGSHFTAAMFTDAQIESQLKYKNEIEDLKKEICCNNRTQESSPDVGDLRVVLLGKTGIGKSAAGNTILGTKPFKELLSSRSVTSECQKESAEVRGRQITVIDTPGLFDTSISNEEIRKEIVKCITMAAPGPHVFLLVLTVGRFTQEEHEAVKMIQDLFGDESRRYTVVLFTRGDDLQAMTIEKFIKDSERSLQNIINQCGNRYHVFNNRNTEDHSQVTALLEKIESMVKVNGGSCYTNEMFQQTEKALQEEQERILKEREEEIERQKEELKAKHEAEMETMKKTMEEERQKQETDKKIREKEFKEREDQIKREFTEREQLEREQYKRRKEEDDEKMKEWMAEINREREENRERWEKQKEEDQRWRDQEEEKRRTKEEEWQKKQGEEKEKFNKEKDEMIQKQRDQEQKLQQEYEQKAAEEKKKREELEEKIKHAEESKKKDLLELQLTQQREWKKRMQEEEERRKEQENNWNNKMESMEKEWQILGNEKKEQYEQEKRIELERRALEDQQRKQREEEEKRRIENEANEKIKQIENNLKRQRETEAKEREEKYKKEMEENLRTQRENFQKQEEEKERLRKGEEERNLAYMRMMHEQEKEKLRRETELKARREAEKEFCIKLDEKVKEAKTEGHEEGFSEGEKKGHGEGFSEGEKAGAERVEAQRTIPGKCIDAPVNMIWNLFVKEKPQ